MNKNFTCDETRERLALLLYGELNFDEEEHTENHLDTCAECGAELARHKEIHAALAAAEITPSPALLASCRSSFAGQLERESGLVHAPRSKVTPKNTWDRWMLQLHEMFSFSSPSAWLRPVGAMALLVAGFVGAKLTPGIAFNSNGSDEPNLANLMGSGGLNVRNVVTGQNGTVHIIVDETRERTFSGNMEDPEIRGLLKSAARDSQDPGLRAQTLTILTPSIDSSDVREAVMFALANDQNSQVRQRAIDALTQERGRDMDREMISLLQDLMSREHDEYVRQRAERMLRSINASTGVY